MRPQSVFIRVDPWLIEFEEEVYEEEHSMEDGAYRTFGRDRALFVRAVHAVVGWAAGVVEAACSQDIAGT
jgi:hypothetical protein